LPPNKVEIPNAALRKGRLFFTVPVALVLSVLSGTVCAQQAGPCDAMMGAALDQCRANQQTLQQQKLGLLQRKR
jgi:hypothetical protein